MRADPEGGVLAFARAFVGAGGVQIPGRPDAGDEARALGERLIRALRAGAMRHPDDRDLQREVDRARREARWALAGADDKVVGFFIVLPPGVEDESATAEALSHASQGLGPGVFAKGDIVVLQPELDGTRFQPVLEDEIEC